MTAESPLARPSVDPAAGLSLLARDVRDHDPARFQTSLFAPVARREDLMALHAFHVELARVAGTVSEPLIGQMRYQWWRDQVNAACDGEVPIKGHPVGEGLTAIIRTHGLERDALLSIIDARETDLDARPFAAEEDILCQARASVGTINGMAARILGVADPELLAAAEQIGMAWGLLTLARTCALDAYRGRLTLPTESCAAAGVTVETLAVPEGAKAARVPLRRVVALAQNNLQSARLARGRVRMGWVPPFLMARLCDHYIGLMENCDYSPHDPRLLVVPRMPLRLFFSAVAKRF
ncbi:MAG: squalene/phytoene synthase family protein [Rhodospirillum sp.]|nr:squalene/phytoene synthase family protein [Rhodospirillum sp.]MCF8490293.1 squalene/phytoene synthase family protein [Rhodospirillum sp.]MCF8499337.1 squalene/phytoene synthase family protein [Rhodospirillum sp.]